jgi:large subunit ribosomal protein L27Ae
MGYGRVGQHRKSPGGRGLAGGMHHERIAMNKYHPGYYGKTGMRQLHHQPNWDHCPVINTDKLWALVSEETRKAAQAKKGEALVIDVTAHGYHKVLGKGELPKIPIVVKAKFFSKTAQKRIGEAGGACVLVA